MPALLTTTSTPPSSSTVRCTPASISPARVTSMRPLSARPPSAAMSEAVSAAVSSTRSTAITAAPSWAKRSAVWRPMPDPAPVTSATLSCSLPIAPPSGPARRIDARSAGVLRFHCTQLHTNRSPKSDITSAGTEKTTEMTERLAADAAAETAPAAQQGPLLGVRVVELGILLAGPFVGRILGDFGAEIIKVEAPDRGDTLRDWGSGHLEGRGLWWPVQSRNKKLVTLNLRVAEGQDLLRRLVAESDVLVENFRPGTLERWNLSPEDLWEVNPGLVIARVSGYGQTGPYAKRAGFASAGEAMGGLRYINGFPGQAPPRLGISLGDSLAAMFTAQGVLM